MLSRNFKHKIRNFTRDGLLDDHERKVLDEIIIRDNIDPLEAESYIIECLKKSKQKEQKRNSKDKSTKGVLVELISFAGAIAGVVLPLIIKNKNNQQK